MRYLITILAFPFLFPYAWYLKNDPVAKSKTFTVEVKNGYGSGTYKVNDTVHIFSKSSPGHSFSNWNGDTFFLKTPEWHSWFIMPSRDVKLTAVETTSSNPELNFEKIKGLSNDKAVYNYFPKVIKGAVFLFHGSGGSASQFAGSFESRYFTRELINAGYGVIITECEEATLNKDINKDGHKRWNYLPADKQRNIDFANIDIIRSEFIKRGIIENTTPLFAAGMSNGGAFSAMVAPALEFNAAISYCAQAPAIFAIRKKMPVMYAMQANDSHEAVGTNGNKKAFENFKALQAAGICSKYFENPRSPLYPERFSRHPEISLHLSRKIFEEIKSSGFMDEKNFMMVSGRELGDKFRKSPQSFPVIRKLTIPQMLFVAEQVDCSYADHRMFSDLSKTSIKFLDSQCR